MSLLAIGGVIDTVGKVIDDLHTSEKESRELDIKELEVRQQGDLAQTKVNAIQAAHPSLFVAGGRPAIIWVGALSLAWTYVAHPVLMWVWSLAQAWGYIKPGMSGPPTLDTDTLMVIVTGVLGIGAMRSVDKRAGKDTRAIASSPSAPSGPQGDMMP
jgi:Holin of 3TMs, for gene-transfer release